ncbi:MAG: non-heme iron oxygenase ferredoxin subunit [Proteobacteria bacterium]|nr:MAG: non-heme iron oxygenase ferredoxin subunit [Pseudomonadota bacterium]
MREVAVAKDSDLAAEDMLAVEVDDMRVVLFKDSQGCIYALEDRCSHADVPLSEGSFSNCEVECMAHGARFDVRSGKQLCMPAVAPVKSFKVRVQEGVILLELPV